MSKQQLLFVPERSPWVDRLWRQFDPKKRREIVAVLAEMARLALTQAQPSDAKRKETSDES